MRLLLTLGLLALAHTAAAQRPDTTLSPDSLKRLSIEQLLNLQITSVSKRPERLVQAASAIQVITQEDIRRSGASSLPEALRMASNLHVAQVDSRQWAISARGFASTTANKLLVLIDGRIVYTPLFSGVFWDVQEVPLTEVDRIEVISGPGSTLWGANAVNGVINVITKHAQDSPGLRLRAGGGTEQQAFGTLRYGGALGANTTYRIYARGFGRDATVMPNGQSAADDWHMAQGGFRVDVNKADATRLTLQGDLYDGRIGQLTAGDIAVSGGNVMAKWSHDFSETASLSAQIYYDRTHRDIPGTFGEDLDIYDVDVHHRTRLGARHDVVWGLGYRLMNDHVTNSAGLAFLPAHVARDWVTAFVHDEIALVPDRLHLALGTKVEHNDYTGFEIQPSGRVNWALSPSATVWTAVTRALRTPSRIDRELFAPGMPPYLLAGGAGFDSEAALSYELGYRHQRGTLSLSLATFYTHYRGLRSVEQQNPPAATPLVIANGQDGESYGAELAVQYFVSERWRVSAGFTEVRVSIWPNPGSTDTTHGAAESRTPDRQFFLHSSLDLPGHLVLDAGFRALAGIENHQVPAYAELNARLTWRALPSLDLSLVGQNLLHESHAEFGAPATRRSVQRSVYGAVEWRF